MCSLKRMQQKKDQSYFLYGIHKEILPYVIFPLSEFKDKSEIRKIAEENNLEVAKKKDSQEVCFIPDNDYINFLKQYNGNVNKEGNIVLKQWKSCWQAYRTYKLHSWTKKRTRHII